MGEIIGKAPVAVLNLKTVEAAGGDFKKAEKFCEEIIRR